MRFLVRYCRYKALNEEDDAMSETSAIGGSALENPVDDIIADFAFSRALSSMPVTYSSIFDKFRLIIVHTAGSSKPIDIAF